MSNPPSFSQEETRLLQRIRSVLGGYLLRLLLIIAVFSIIIILFLNKIFAFMAGFSTIILVILGEAIAALPRMKKWKS